MRSPSPARSARPFINRRPLASAALMLATALAGCERPAPVSKSETSAVVFETHVQAATLSGFTDQVIFQNRVNPIAVRFATNGKIFVAEEAGRIYFYDNLSDTTPTLFADLRAEVNSYWDRGMLGFTLDPNYASNGFMYVLYTHDTGSGENGTSNGNRNGTDTCPTPPGGTTDGCMTYGRISRLQDPGSGYPIATRLDLLTEWPQQFPSHAIGALNFGPDGQLYATGGDGAAFNKNDYGQYGIPKNPAGDPPAGVGGTMTSPTSRGGSLRSQSLRRPAGENVVLNGSVIRIDPGTGLASSGNPNASHSDLEARRIVAMGLRNPYRFTFHPTTGDIWIGDVGDVTWEEINRLQAPLTGAVRNFGWPCYEGANSRSPWNGFNLCSGLSPTAPYYSYQHDQPVYSGDACGTGGSAITGVAFYPATGAGNYPSSYRNAMFFSDLPRDCIFVVFPNATTGLPNMATRTNFISAAANPVDLVIGPNNDLFYVDYGGDGGTTVGGNGKLHRVRYQAPTAIATANPTSGFSPLVVNFTGSMSTPGVAGDTLTYAWDLDGDGQYDDSTAQNPSRTYNTAATIAVRLKVTDQRGGFGESQPLQIVVGSNTTPPEPVIDTPLASLTWKVGDNITFSGGASDEEDGTIAASGLVWELIMQHCPSACHEHLVQTFEGVASGSFPAPDHEYPSYLQLRLTATDSHGVRTTVFRDIQPQTVVLSFSTSPAASPGLNIGFNLESPAAPFSRTVIKGSTNSLTATTPQTRGNTRYDFQSWSDGGAVLHDVVANADASFTVNYTTTVIPWLSADVGAVASAGSWSENNGTHTIAGNGADIWNAADEFRFTYQQLTGDGSITARVVSFNNPSNVNGKAGVMIRQSLNANSAHVMAALPPQGTTTLVKAIKRTATGATAVAESATGTATFPRWVRVTRVGTTLTAFQSTNGTSFTQLGTPSAISGLTGTVFIGLAVSSHTDGTNGTAVFDQVVLVTPAPPGAPSSLIASGGVNQAVLNWTDTSNNETGFKIERKLTSAADSTYAQVGTSAANVATFTNSSVPAGDYSYRVRATNANGDSAYSNAATATVVNPAPPMAPSGLTGNGGVSQATLNWTDNSSSETGFVIERKLQADPDTSFAQVGTVGASVTTFINSGVAGGVYSYRVKATSAAGDSGYSNSTDVTITNPPPPGAPSGLVASGGVAQAVLSWLDGSNNETGFKVERKLSADPDSSFAQVGTTGQNVATFTNSAVPGGDYTYRVRATNAVGDSPYSNSATATVTDPQPPAPPSGLNASGGVNQAVLSWTDNASDETGFKIERKLAADPDSSFAQVGTAAVNATGFTNSSVTPGVYSYRVRSTNTVGDSAYSNSANATVTSPAAPAAPTGLVATAGNAQVGLVWNAVSGATSYTVKFSTVSGGPYSIAQAGVTGTSYTHTGRTNGTTYVYVVSASGVGGEGPNSAQVSATPSAPAWLNGDIGGSTPAGSFSLAGSTFTVQGGGADVQGTADQFHFVYRQVTGNATIIARMNSLSLVSGQTFTKGGIMMRDGTGAGALNAFMLATTTASNGFRYQYRTAVNQTTTQTRVTGNSAIPTWFRLVRSGNSFTASTSTNGTSWTAVSTQTIAMGTTILVGLAVTSHSTTALTTGVFDNVSVTTP